MIQAGKLRVDHSKPTLLTFDAFGTLFRPRASIGKLYADSARRHGLKGFTNEDIDRSFHKAYKHQSALHPNFGKAVGVKAFTWWAWVIHLTFLPYVKTETLPEGLVPDLWDVFTTERGYELLPSVLPFFTTLRKKREVHKSKICTGIISNSDDRVPLVLSSLGLKVNAKRSDNGTNVIKTVIEESLESEKVEADFDFVTMSYDVGFSKPAHRIFDAALQLSGHDSPKELNCIHIGDNISQDYHGALEAGWQAIMFDDVDTAANSGQGKYTPDHVISRVENFDQLQKMLDIAIFSG